MEEKNMNELLKKAEIRSSFSFWQLAPIASPTIKISDNDANINPPFLFLDMSIAILAARILTVSKLQITL